MTSHENPSRRLNDRSVNLVALLAQAGAARGAPPTEAELERYRAGTLAPARAEEVESYLAYDPGAFDAYMALAARSAKRADAPLAGGRARLRPARPRPLFALPAALAAAFAVAAVAVGLVFVMGGSGPGMREIAVRGGADAGTSTAAAASDWRRDSFRVGFRTGGRGGSVPAGQALARQCAGNDCAGEGRALADLGALAKSLDDGCAAGTAPGAAASSQARDLEQRIADREWRRVAEQLATAADRGATGCADVRRVAERAK